MPQKKTIIIVVKGRAWCSRLNLVNGANIFVALKQDIAKYRRFDIGFAGG